MIQQLTPALILGIILGYFLLLIVVSFFTGKDTSNESFFLAGRRSPWFVVAFGMIGATLSGVTFISIPGAVGAGGANQAFSYMQLVLGYLLGYAVIALVLLPLYYRLNLTSIYTYLEQRFGFFAYKTGAAYFLLSRAIGASFRLFLVAIVLQKFVMDYYGVPFWATVLVTIVLIWVYTFRGGIKTIVWTDTLQTLSMLAAVVMTIVVIGQVLEMDLPGLVAMIRNSEYSQVFYFQGGWNDPNNFFKQFFSGALITIVMTGLDQDMMQKNLTCRSLGDAQKNMFTFSIILVFVNLLFLSLGALLYIYAANVGLDVKDLGRSDQLFPTIAIEHLPPAAGIVFVLGLIAAAYSSADSALTSLTTSFSVDFLNLEATERTPEHKRRIRTIVHISTSVVLFFIVLFFSALNNDAIINQLFKAAGYTYGPLLGLFSFGILTNRTVEDTWKVAAICVAAPIISFLLDMFSMKILFGFQFGFLILAANGLLTFAGLWLISQPGVASEESA